MISHSGADPVLGPTDRIVQRVAELSDRTSPDDWPEAMLVTATELREIVESVLREAAAALSETPKEPQFDQADVQLLAWAVTNCHMLARRALARSTSVYDREKWEHVLRICEKAGARSPGVLRASVPTELTEGAGSPVPPEGPTQEHT